MARFADRTAAGTDLGRLLAERGAGPDALVLGLPRGGVPVARAVAGALGAELDVLVVAKLRVPGQPELAFGAVASGGVRWLHEGIVTAAGLSGADVERISAAGHAAVAEREERLRPSRPRPTTAGRTVIVVDDGIATGATVQAAVIAARLLGAARVGVAAPVATPSVVAALRRVADRVDVVEERTNFGAVSVLYDDFGQTTEDEVRALLEPAVAPQDGVEPAG